MSRDDVAVADMLGRKGDDFSFLSWISFALGVPCLSAEPDVARLYSTKSGGRIIFADAKVFFRVFPNVLLFSSFCRWTFLLLNLEFTGNNRYT